jgi:hypothetical protein
MGMIYGSMRHTSTGRKKKKNYWSTKKRTPEFKPYTPPPSFRRETPEYPSHGPTQYTPENDKSYQLEESKKFTVAPAYNKGAYQVIPKSDIEHIGK